MATDFTINVVKFISKIPKGKVATYGQIAALAGKPHGARGVSWILHSSSEAHNLPWFRVLNAKGAISFPPSSRHFLKQKRFLEKEGVEFLSANQVNLAKCQWSKKPVKKKMKRNSPSMFGNEFP